MLILLDNKCDCRPRRCIVFVARELNCYNTDIAALSETLEESDGQIEEVGEGYNFLFF